MTITELEDESESVASLFRILNLFFQGIAKRLPGWHVN
jgi:hypothetical protein